MNDAAQDRDSCWHLWLDAVLHSYAIIYFSQKRLIGLLILICTFFQPLFGLAGLCGLIISLVAALLLGLHRESIRNGSYLFNSLLVSLTLASYVAALEIRFPTAIALLVIGSLMTLIATVALSSFMFQHLGLPSLTLPLVAGHFLLHCVMLAFPLRIFEFRPAIQIDLPYVRELSRLLNSYGVGEHLEVLGTILFLPNPIVGVLVLIALFLHSRLAVLFALTGFAAALGVVKLLGPDVTSAQASLIAFNGLFCGLALGGVFFIPSRGSLVLAAMGGALAAAIGVALANVLRPLEFFPVVLPMNLAVLPVLYVLRQRPHPKHLFVATAPASSPEESFRNFRLFQTRFPNAGLPTILCPFPGKRVVTQGVNGRHTHRGYWQYALDFEVWDQQQRRNLGVSSELSDYYTFHTPVLSPGYGTVVKVVDYIEDRPIGANNFADNWGNLVIIRLDEGPHVKLCHLQQRSIAVAEGWRVKPGDVIAQCGNSGRSPVPHLHVQLQASAQVGATTIPFRLRHYIEQREQRFIYHATGLPPENARIQGAVFDQQLAQAFDNIGRRTYRYRLRYRGREHEESITCRVDDLGYYVFESSAGARMRACVTDHVFYALEYRGRTSSVLHWLFVGLCRVPLISDREAVWQDTLDIRPLLRRGARWFFDFSGPFFYYPRIHTTSAFLPVAAGDGHHRDSTGIETTFHYPVFNAFLKGPVASKVAVQVTSAHWVTSATIHTPRDILTIEQLFPQ